MHPITFLNDLVLQKCDFINDHDMRKIPKSEQYLTMEDNRKIIVAQ